MLKGALQTLSDVSDSYGMHKELRKCTILSAIMVENIQSGITMLEFNHCSTTCFNFEKIIFFGLGFFTCKMCILTTQRSFCKDDVVSLKIVIQCQGHVIYYIYIDDKGSIQIQLTFIIYTDILHYTVTGYDLELHNSVDQFQMNICKYM